MDLLKNEVVRDTAVYAGYKYITNKAPSMADLTTFAVSDVLYNSLLRAPVEKALNNGVIANPEVSRLLTDSIGVSVTDWALHQALGRKKNFLDLLVDVGASQALDNLVVKRFVPK